MQAAPRPRVEPSEPLYLLVGLGLLAYARATHRVTVLGASRLRLRRGLVLAATHRFDADVPLIAAALLFRAGIWKPGAARPSFAARDDLFERGALAALVPGLPAAARHVLFSVDPAGLLGRVRVNPARSRKLLKVVQALRAAEPATALHDVLAPGPAARLRSAADEAGLAAPRTAGDAVRPELVDALWESVRCEELRGSAGAAVRRRRALDATADLRRLAELVRAGEPLVYFPEGTPSRDGALGPVRRGFSVVVRAGRPEALLPVAIAYDRMVTGRPRAFVSIGEELRPRERDAREETLDAFRRSMPLTCGQAVAAELVGAAEEARDGLAFAELDAAVTRAVERAHEEHRPLDPVLAHREGRRHRLADCLCWLARQGIAGPADDGGSVVFEPEEVLGSREVAYAAREHAAARSFSRPRRPASDRVPEPQAG